jgi:hypothetical protein
MIGAMHQPRYVLVIRDIAHRGDAPAPTRLKGVLKRLLRSWGFVAVSVRPASTKEGKS